MLWCVCLDNTIGFTSAQEQEENSGLAHKASLFYYCPFFPTIPLSHPPISYTFFSLQNVTLIFSLVAFLSLFLSLKFSVSFSLWSSNYALNSSHAGRQDEIDLPLCSTSGTSGNPAQLWWLRVVSLYTPRVVSSA